MRRVVYLLGAGFSAPLGLPVMANFLAKAKDQYYETDDTFEHFGPVLETIAKLHVANAYYSTDVFNIEDILSILDMQDRLVGTKQGTVFKRFLADVVSFYTPALPNVPSRTSSWAETFFGPDHWGMYGAFAAILLGQRFVRHGGMEPGNTQQPSYTCDPNDSTPIEYSVITLNYDVVLETAAAHLRGNFAVGSTFARTLGGSGVPLVKLHGSIDSDDIVPPTWSKSFMTEGIQSTWEYAYRVLTNANDLRIVGFSLPEADAYVRYLLRAAVIDTPNLKRIHVLCKDSDNQVEARYDRFVTFRNWRFVNDDTTAYLAPLVQGEQWPRTVDYRDLERAHANLFGLDA